MGETLKASVLLASGRKMPMVGLGTYRLQGSNVHKSIKSALSLGYRLIDTTPGMEAMTRIGISGHPRPDLFLTIKTMHGDRESAATLALRTMSALKVGFVDLLVLRSPAARGMEPEHPRHLELRMQGWKGLEKLHKEGKALSLGVCDFSIAHLESLLQQCQVPPSVQMAEITPLNTNSPLIAFCKAHNIVLQAYSPLANGHSALLSHPKVLEIAANVGKSPCQVVLKWTIQQGICVIPKSLKAEHQRENGNLDFCLSSDQMDQLSSLNTGFKIGWDSSNIA